MTTSAVHPNGLTATQSLAFFKANGITGTVIKTFRTSQIREFTHLVMLTTGNVRTTTTRIKAMPQHFA